MTKDTTGGMRLFSFRQGDRSEYLALYALTRVAFVTPVPRQEDFGVVDFKCVLAKQEKNKVYPRGTFNIQVKSSEKRIKLNNAAIRWISTNMDSPLFICMVDKKGTRIKIYSCLNLWPALFLRMYPNEITLYFGKLGPDGVAYSYFRGETGDPDRDLEGKFDVFLGKPVIDMELSEFETKADIIYNVLQRWIAMDHFNVALMRFGRSAACLFQDWTPNEIPTKKLIRIFDRPVNQHGLLNKLILPLHSLASSYLRAGRPDRAEEIGLLINTLTQDMVDLGDNNLDKLLE